MKKRNFIFGFLFAILTAFTFGLKFNNTAKTYAAGVFTISFDANQGTCSTTSQQTTSDGTLSSLPTPSRTDYVFDCWINGDTPVTTSTVFSEDTTVVARYQMKNFEYHISKPDSNYSIIGKTLNADFDYTLSNTCSSLENAIDLIKSDLSDDSKQVTLNFNNISLEKNLELNFKNLTLSGTLNLANYSINYSTPIENSVLNFKDLTLNSTSSQNQVNISGEHHLSMEISNAKFNSTQSENNYAFFVNTNSVSINVTNKISHETAYLYNHSTSSSALMQDIDVSEQASGFLSITTPYNTDSSVVLTSNIDSSKFRFVPLSNNYTCTLVKNGMYLQVKVNFNIKFNANAGTMDSSFENIQTRFNPSNQLDYPTSQNLTKSHSTLNGFAGKITLSSEQMAAFSTDISVWYFDKIMLEEFLENAIGYEDIPNYFATSLPAANNNGFTYYKKDASFTDLNFSAVVIMLDLEQTPEFVALWSDTIYSITFETNGGTDVSNISGIYNSSITLPSTSKTGYSFSGWYSSSDFEESSLKTPSNFSQMPDTNPTLYAKWTAVSTNLIIHPNNGQNEFVVSVEYNSPLSLVTELGADYFSKTGYSLVGWYEDESLSDDKLISDLSTFLMPYGEVSVYAKWQVNQYTITLKTNHPKDNSDFKSLTANYGDDVSSLKAETPSFEGYTFEGWNTLNSVKVDIPNTMPAENLTLYATWSKISYRLYYYLNNNTYYHREILHFEDEITPPNTPVVSGFIFNGWYTSPELTTPFNLTSMPSHDVYVYANMLAKKTITIDQNPQSYGVSSNNGFVLKIKLNDFKIEYLVNDKWQTDVPNKKGTYNVRITRAEDSVYNLVNIVIEDGYSVVPDSIDITIYYIFLYILAAIEIVAAIIVMFLRKQRQSYLTYAVALPFGLVTNNDFINLIISLTLAIFGFVLLIMQYTKFKKVNIEIQKQSDKNKEYTPPDVSTNDSISSNVDDLLKKEGLATKQINKTQDFVEINDDGVSDYNNTNNTETAKTNHEKTNHDESNNASDTKFDIDSL